MIIKGHLSLQDRLDPPKLYIGPCPRGKFYAVNITSLHRHRIPTQFVHKGQVVSFAIDFEGRPRGDHDETEKGPCGLFGPDPEPKKRTKVCKQTRQKGKQGGEPSDTPRGPRDQGDHHFEPYQHPFDETGEAETRGTFFFGSDDQTVSSGVEYPLVLRGRGSKKRGHEWPVPLKLRKGIVLLSAHHPCLESASSGPLSCTHVVSTFEADVHVLSCNKSIHVGLHGVCFVGSVRQSAKIVMIKGDGGGVGGGVGGDDKNRGKDEGKDDSETDDTRSTPLPTETPSKAKRPLSLSPELLDGVLKTDAAFQATLSTGDRARVVFHLSQPEFVSPSVPVVFRADHNIKLIGKVAVARG